MSAVLSLAATIAIERKLNAEPGLTKAGPATKRKCKRWMAERCEEVSSSHRYSTGEEADLISR